MYFFKFIVGNLSNSLHALIESMAYNNTIYLIIVAYLVRRKIAQLFADIRAIKSKYIFGFEFLE